MSSPVPPIALQSPCSVIYDNVLYVYSPAAFQSLELQKGGKWSTLPMGVSVTGANCVLGTSSGVGSSPALWVIGGTTNSSSSSYPGLQMYNFANKSWNTITPQVPVTAGRLHHASVFLESSASILVYAGGQNGSTVPSSDTFLISTMSPYGVTSNSTHLNPPATQPILLPWTTNSAITLGGSSTNKNIYEFIPGNGWSEYQTKLTFTLNPSTYFQAALITGDDNSKVLQIYDLSSSPNKVAGVLLQNANGSPAPAGETIGAPPAHSSSRKRKRKLTEKNWPSYNGANAPNSPREGCSLAIAPSGLVVFAGGSSEDPIVLFDLDTNSWVNNTLFFGANNIKQQSVLAAGYSSTAMSTSPTTLPSSSPSAAPPSDGMSSHTTLLIGIVLGSILGAIALLGIILLCCWWRRSRNRKWDARNFEDEKQRMSFADRGDPLMKEAGGSIPYQFDGSRSQTSLAMVGNRPIRHQTHPSDSSTTHLVKKGGPWPNEPVEMDIIKGGSKSSPGLNTVAPIITPQAKSAAAKKPKRTSAWSRYWSGSANKALAEEAQKPKEPPKSNEPPKPNVLRKSPSRKSTFSRKSSTNRSNHSASSSHDCTNHGPVEIPPLQLGQQFDGERINNVVSGSPRLSRGSMDIQKGQSATLERSKTSSSLHSHKAPSTIDDSIYAHEVAEETSSWTPVSRNDWSTPGYRGTTTSSIYTDVNHRSIQMPPDRMSQSQNPMPRMSTQTNATRASNLTIWPQASIMPVISEPPPRPINPNVLAEQQANAKVDTRALQPPQQSQPLEYKKAASDLNWLNLGSSTT